MLLALAALHREESLSGMRITYEARAHSFERKGFDEKELFSSTLPYLLRDRRCGQR